MNIRQLEYVLAVDKFKNFSRAAENCHVTQATLSAMIKKLEEELDIVIFDRKSNPVLTTEEGAEILVIAEKIVQHANQLVDRANSIKGNIEGEIKIGIIPTIAGCLLPKIIRPLIEQYPRLKLEFKEITTDDMIHQLKIGQLDAGIAATPMSDKDIEENILYYEALMVYGDKDQDKRFMMPEEIKEHKIWMLEEGHCLREQFIKLCSLRKKDVLPENLKFQANSFETLLNLVDEFGGLTLIPELYFNLMPEDRKEKVTFFNQPIPVREVSMIYFRPYAKIRTIEAISTLITEQIKGTLLADTYKNSELSIAAV